MGKRRRLDKINKHLQKTFGEILQREADLPVDTLTTIVRVDTTPNLKSTTIWLSIYPTEKAEAVLKHLTPQLYLLQGALNRALDARPLPRLYLRIDYGAEHAQHVDDLLATLDHEDEAAA